MKRCTHPLWRTTRKHIQEARRIWCKSHGGISRLVWFPVKALRRVEWIDFMSSYMGDYKGGRPYIRKIAKAMCQRIPLPPAIGYYTEDGTLVLWDGNHRASAAKIAGVEKMPVVVCGKRRPR